jgi:hypothetical protein
LPLESAGWTTSTYSTTPSLIGTGTFVVLTTAAAIGLGGVQLAGAAVRA